MDIGIRAAREQVAKERITAAAEVLAGRFEVHKPSWPTGNQPELVALWQLEMVADLLEELAAVTARTSKASKTKFAPAAPAEEVNDGA